MEVMSQSSYHKVMVQIKSYIENVKCLLKYKAKGSSAEYKTSCLVKDGPAKKSCIILVGKQDIQEHIKKKSTRRGYPISPKIYSSFPEVFRHMPEWAVWQESPGAWGHWGQTSHPTPKADRLRTKAQTAAGIPSSSRGVYTMTWGNPAGDDNH